MKYIVKPKNFIYAHIISNSATRAVPTLLYTRQNIIFISKYIYFQMYIYIFFC